MNIIYMSMHMIASLLLIKNVRGVNNPIIIVPGIMCSNLEYKLTNATQNKWCPQNSEWSEMFTVANALETECLFEYSSLDYDDMNGCVKDPNGVSVRPRDYGGIRGINYFTETLVNVPVFEKIDTVLQSHGYIPGVSLRGNSYDWRKFGDECAERIMNKDLKDMITDTYESNNQTKVVMICHSMGCNLLLHLLVYYINDVSFNDKYIESVLMMSPANGGSAKVPVFLASGPNYGPNWFGHILRDVTRTWPSLYSLLPKQFNGINGHVWNDSIPILSTPSRQYSPSDIHEYVDFIASNASFVDSIMVRRVMNYISTVNMKYDITATLPTTHIIYVRDVDTDRHYHYDNEDIFTSNFNLVAHGKGDGSVNEEAMAGLCNYLKLEQTNSSIVKCTPLELGGKVDHYSMLFDDTVINMILTHLNLLPVLEQM